MEFVAAVGIVVIFLIIIHKLWTALTGQTHSSKNSVLEIFNVKHPDLIKDKFTSLDCVTKAIRQAGLESSNLIFGIDYTISNIEQGKYCFGGNPLHTINPEILNPYQKVISIVGETLAPFDEDGVIPTFGFGDLSTKDQKVFPFREQGFCTGFSDVLQAYNLITPSVKMSGPTSFAPLIKQAIDIVKRTKMYHILVIVADGQVTSEAPTRRAIEEASHYPLSIVLVGVGDGPWGMMKEFDDSLPKRKFDNFQFVNFSEIISSNKQSPEAIFALHALMEIPDQYKTIRRLGLLDL